MHSWIIALPRMDMERCITIGCFGKEKPGDRLAEVSEGDGIACYATKESKIIALGRVTRGYYYDETPKFLKEGTFGYRFDFSAQLLGDNEIDVSSISKQLTSIPERGNFGLLVKSGFRIITPEDWVLLCEQAHKTNLLDSVLDAERTNSHKWWWVNQGRTYTQERKGGYIWAPQKGKDGQEIFHHLNVSRVKAGDSIFHYVDGNIVAVSTAKEDAVNAPKPIELPSELWAREGFMARVNYVELKQPVAREAIPYELRTKLGNENKSPFTKAGSVNQGYLFEVPEWFAIKMLEHFPHLAPTGAEIVTQESLANEQDLERFLTLIRNLRVNRENGVTRLYKPAVILAIIDGLDANTLKENHVYYDWLFPAFAKVLATFGKIGDEKQAATAFFHLQNEPFWELKLKQPNQAPLRGEPAQIRQYVEYASFASPFWSVLNDKSYRQQIRKVICEQWFESELPAEGNEMFDYKVSVANLILSIEQTGFTFEPWQIACYITALRTKPFLILAGVSGSGKSQLPQLISTATGGYSELVPVRPDWTDSSDILGYVQLQGRLRPGPLLRLADEATHSSKRHFTCIIDEMNLARVEHYFAEILSRIEESRSNGGTSGRLLTQSLASEDKKWESVFLPSNLAMIGTVNMDESSHGFSRKVLDRAFTLEFSEIDLTNWESKPKSDISTIHWPAFAWQPRSTHLSSLQGLSENERAQITMVVNTLVDLNKLLSHAQLQLAYRSRDEISLFVLHANDLRDSFVTRSGKTVDPLDLALQMKVLPRIAGGSGPIRRLVLALLGWSGPGNPFKDEDEASALMSDWSDQNKPHFLDNARFPRTCARLCLMWERIQTEGFTSYWL